MERSYAVSRPVHVDVRLPAGQLDVDLLPSGTSARVLLEPMAVSGKQLERAQAAIDETTIALEGGRLRVHVPDMRHSAEIHMTIAVPDLSGLEAKTASADVTVTGGALSDLDVKSASGDVQSAEVAGRACFATTSGDLSCATVGGDVQVATASGDVRLGTVHGYLRWKTASGDLRVDSLGPSSGGAELRSASGDVAIGNASSGEVSASTVSGDVRLGVAPGVGAWLDIATLSGDTRCDLPHEPEGRNAASLVIVCRTVSGDVAIRQAVSA